MSIEEIREQIDNCKVTEVNERTGKLYLQWEKPVEPGEIPEPFEMVIDNFAVSDVTFT